MNLTANDINTQNLYNSFRISSKNTTATPLIESKAKFS